MDKFSDENLVGQYLSNKDEKALEELVKRYLPLIYGFVRKYTGNQDTASDIVQETFVKVWQNLNKFDQSKSFKAWIFTIAKRTALDWLKKKNALPFSAIEENEEDKSFIDSLADDAISVLEQLSQNELSKNLAFAVNQLPPHQKSVINLRIEGDLTFNEIAQLLEMPLNTVRSHYRRGVALLKRILEL